MTVRQAQDFIAKKWGARQTERLVIYPKDTFPQYNVLVIDEMKEKTSLQSTKLIDLLPSFRSDNKLTRELSDVASRFNPESNLKPNLLRVALIAFLQLFPKTKKSDTTTINKYPIRILHNKGVE